MRRDIGLIERVYSAPPEFGEAHEVIPGLFWARLPLPFRLDHVNVWLLAEPDGLTAIDCGLNSEETWRAWDRLLNGAFHGRPLRRLVATHGHTDHVGAAGLLTQRHDIPFLSTLCEWQAAKLRISEMSGSAGQAFLHFLEQHGCDRELRDAFAADRKGVSQYLGPIPDQIIRMQDGDCLMLGGRSWRVIVSGGHADEHASLWCEEDRVLIAGDQVLERITPVIAVQYPMPEADPLTDYLDSLERFQVLSEDALILPSHGVPYRGLHTRLGELSRHHDERLEAALKLANSPVTSLEVSHKLFPRASRAGQGRLALAETIAHLHRLVKLDRLQRLNGDGKLLRYERAA